LAGMTETPSRISLSFTSAIQCCQLFPTAIFGGSRKKILVCGRAVDKTAKRLFQTTL
jgi:hypothetical protein